jgi:membrane protein
LRGIQIDVPEKQFLRVVLIEAATSFSRNNNLRSASSMAFNTMLALIPALFLLTSLLGTAIGSSESALLKTRALAEQFIPRFSEVVIREVGQIAAFGTTLSLVNLLLLLWSITPLVGSIRTAIETIFKTPVAHSFVARKVLDIIIVLTLVTAFSVIAALGVVLNVFVQIGKVTLVSSLAASVAAVVVVVFLVLLIYLVFMPRVRWPHLLAGSVTTAALWLVMRPAFSLFLTFNPGFGLAFGSFKSLFIVIIWIYYSQAVFLFGAEVTSAMSRKDSIMIRRLMEGKRMVPAGGRSRFVSSLEPGRTIFEEGDSGSEMYFVLKGSVSIRKEGREIAVIPAGKHFGEMSFLLAEPRTAAAVAGEDCELIVIDSRNIELLMREFPGYIRDMLTEMARRLKETNALVQ